MPSSSDSLLPLTHHCNRGRKPVLENLLWDLAAYPEPTLRQITVREKAGQLRPLAEGCMNDSGVRRVRQVDAIFYL